MTATSTLDDYTTTAIREAISAATRGRLTEACAIGERALASGGDIIALNAMLGMLRCQSGQVEAGAEHLRAAYEGRPTDQKIAVNLANALAELKRHQEALEVLTEELSRTDPTMNLERLRGFLAQSAEDFPASIRSYERIIEASPSDWEAWNNLGTARRCAGDFEGSIAALRRAVELEPESTPIRLNLAVAIGAAGDLQQSEQLLRELAQSCPKDTQPLGELHALLKDQLRDDEALEAIEEAVRRDPENVNLRLALASHLSQTHRYAAAEAAYLSVIKIAPSNSPANLGLAFVYEFTNQTDRLFELMEETKERDVGIAAREFIRAFGFRRQKRYDDGLKSLEQVPDSMESSRRAHLLGQLLQGAGRYDEAFASFEQMNKIAADDPSQPEQRGAGYRKLIRGQFKSLTPGLVNRFRVDKAPDARRTPAFLLGFPRSGTTLLDTMLMGHSGIEVLEEEPTMREASILLPPVADLPELDDRVLAAARDKYWEIAQSLTPLKSGNLLVDKNPLTMNGLPYLYSLFPGAKLILALRHPCDVVLSCFITNFRANDGMASFLRLDTAAELYDLSFAYFHRAQELLRFPMHTVVYERVVADREPELRSLFKFLELDWSDQVLEHEATAKSRGRIKTASYSQVVEPIYSRAAGRWWNYRKQLEPVLPVLEPWVTKFGYSLDDPGKIPSEAILP